jgi:hypothetical protein
MRHEVDRRRPGPATFAALAAYAGLIAFSAYAGAAGLATGALDMGATINQRLPFRSPVVGGVALALVVGLPMTVVAVRSVQRARNIGTAATVAGVVLVAWIVTELAFILEVSWLQLLFLAVGASFAVIGTSLDRAIPQSVR